MKKTLFTFVMMALCATQVFAVEFVKVTANSIRFYNWSSGNFDMTGMKVSVGNTWHNIGDLTLSSGDLLVTPGSNTELSGINAPSDKGSVGLWYNGVNTSNPNATFLASYVQYGAANQAYENIAVASTLWGAGDFVVGGLPLTRDNDFNSFGVSHWTGSGISIKENHLDDIRITPNPFHDQFTMINSKAFQAEYSIELHNIIGQVVYSKLAIKEDEIRVNTALLESGVYLLRLSDNNGNVLIKRVVKR